ncbi:glycerol-3-phosphate 1-O-acyltransferase PlsY [Sphingosinicella sp. BN140058]|uniref:glycerol-3-phosphate 1-O-acyltransferase PlsY n=1 Tax=Sphingosinicella sp. BN140058 TaxID=1892855 RepID=UPI001011CD2D|nr:glycerol-3-phosphate 1-O-acyltransferase PlsY [Sphingosinicella sp. BN140058]QAY79533.1 glycerol-3-phosphate 1-O-acyltransferase [Sphingosinicella sp. BN140058]
MVTIDTAAGPLLAFLLAYLLGAIPFGILLTRLTGAGDLRKIGSGNIGATNVLRTGRKGLAAATLLLDLFKGTAAVLLAEHFVPGTAQLAAIAALLGHMFPVWLRFAGGKGVATFMGLVLAFAILGDLHWVAPLSYALVWIGLLAVTRISSLAGMSAGLSAPIAAALLGRYDLALMFLGLALLVWWKHRDNLRRLLAGTEPRIGAAKHG